MSASRLSNRWTSSSSTRARSTPAMPAGVPGGGTHWRLSIVSPRFAGQTTLARHRMVYQALGERCRIPSTRSRSRAQPRRNERIPVKTRILAVALLAPPWRSRRCRRRRTGRPPRQSPPRPSPAWKPVATVNGVPVPQSRADYLMQQQLSRGGADTEQMRGMVRDEREPRDPDAGGAKGRHAKQPEVQTQLDMARQEIIVSAYLRDWVRKHRSPTPRCSRNTKRPRQSTATRNTRRATSWWRPRTRPRR